MNQAEQILATIRDAGPQGVSGADIQRLTGITVNSVTAHLSMLKSKGAFFSAGPARTPWVRHFYRLADAAAYQAIGDQARADSKIARAEKRRLAQNARYAADPEKFNAKDRARRAAIRAAKPQKPKTCPAPVVIRKVPEATFGTFEESAAVDMSRAKLTVCPGFVPAHMRPPERVYGGFAALPIGVYAFPPATCAARAA